MLYKKLELVSEIGTAEDQEDGLVISPPIFAVFDGVSTPYSKASPKKRYGEKQLSSGALLVKTASESLQHYSSDANADLKKLLMITNQSIAKLQLTEMRMSLKDSANLAGATFAAARLSGETVEIMQAGDSYAFWVNADGTTSLTKDQVLNHDQRGDNLFRQFQEKSLKENGGDLSAARAAAWDKYLPVLIKQRKKNINNPKSPGGFVLLNGQPDLEKSWFYTQLPKSSLKLLLLFTDGLIDRKKFESDESMKKYLLETYRNGGLQNILFAKRKWERENEKKTYITHTEATAIAIEFSNSKTAS